MEGGPETGGVDFAVHRRAGGELIPQPLGSAPPLPAQLEGVSGTQAEECLGSFGLEGCPGSSYMVGPAEQCMSLLPPAKCHFRAIS